MAKLRIWHIPQVPGKPFVVNVDSVEEGAKILDILAAYDQFQFQQNIKPDFSNAGGVEMYQEDFDGEGNSCWIDWEDDENGYSDYKEYTEDKNLDFLSEIAKENNIKF